MLRLDDAALCALVAHCIRSLPLEGCGLLLGEAGSDHVVAARPARNTAASALTYALDPGDQLAIDREAASLGLEVLGAFHSHTHTEAWPSPTDVALAVDPGWHWVVVSLRRPEPVVRSFVIRGGTIDEEAIVVEAPDEVE